MSEFLMDMVIVLATMGFFMAIACLPMNRWLRLGFEAAMELYASCFVITALVLSLIFLEPWTSFDAFIYWILEIWPITPIVCFLALRAWFRKNRLSAAARQATLDKLEEKTKMAEESLSEERSQRSGQERSEEIHRRLQKHKLDMRGELTRHSAFNVYYLNEAGTLEYKPFNLFLQYLEIQDKCLNFIPRACLYRTTDNQETQIGSRFWRMEATFKGDGTRIEDSRHRVLSIDEKGEVNLSAYTIIKILRVVCAHDSVREYADLYRLNKVAALILETRGQLKDTILAQARRILEEGNFYERFTREFEPKLSFEKTVVMVVEEALPTLQTV